MQDNFDIRIGQRIRYYRKLRGLSMDQLAEAIGVSFQQVQKYERGLNRISFERLYRLSTVFEVPLNAWLEEEGTLPESTKGSRNRQELLLLSAFHTIAEAEHRLLLCRLARALAEKKTA